MRIIIAIIAIAGCGRDASTSTKAASGAAAPTSGAPAAGRIEKPCALMARSDAEAAVGLALPTTNEGVPKTDYDVASCTYNSADYFGVEMIVREWEGFAEGMKLGGSKQPLIAVAGLGDEAWAVKNDDSARLYVRKGERGFVITLNSPALRALPDKGQARAKVLALTIAPRI